MKRAFTMIELVFTMVILSIVAMVATDLIAKTYVSYNQVESQHKANLKVELALNSIANRLSYAIGGTVVKRASRTDTAIAPIDQAPATFQVLEWIGYDVDGFVAEKARATINGVANSGALMPAWSAFCNVLASDRNNIVTPGSDLALESNLIANLSRGDIPTADSLKDIALFFPENYDWTNVGYTATNNAFDNRGVARVNNIDAANYNFVLQANASGFGITNLIREHYKLAWSAYAVVPVNFRTDPVDPNAEQLFDLKLVYNFRPWTGSNQDYDNKVHDDIKTYGDAANNESVNESLLVTNVTVFKTYATENRIHIKLCVKEMFNSKKKTSICKERVILR